MSGLFDLTGRRALVTGAGRGIGRAIAEGLAEAGAQVTLCARSRDEIEAACAALAARGFRAAPLVCDVTDIAGFRDRIEAQPAFDVFVNNAGTTHRNGSMLEVDEATFDRVFAVNVKSIYWSALCAVPALRRQGGSIINIASTAGLRPRPGLTWYNGSKGAVVTISKSMAVELAPDNIRVNAICPVIGETGLTAEFMGGDTPELRARFLGTIPLGRMSQPADIAAACVFLASDEAEFFTGVALEVDGGRCV